MKKTTSAKAIFVILVLLLVAVCSTLVQRMLLGANNLAATSAVVSISAFALWRLLWKSTK